MHHDCKQTRECFFLSFANVWTLVFALLGKVQVFHLLAHYMPKCCTRADTCIMFCVLSIFPHNHAFVPMQNFFELSAHRVTGMHTDTRQKAWRDHIAIMYKMFIDFLRYTSVHVQRSSIHAWSWRHDLPYTCNIPFGPVALDPSATWLKRDAHVFSCDILIFPYNVWVQGCTFQ